MKRKIHTRGGNGGKNQRQQQPPISSSMATTRATTSPPPKTAPHVVAAAASPLTTILVRPLLVECLTYLDQPSLREVCLLSTVFLDIVRNDKRMENHRIIKVLEIRPSKNNEDDEGRLIRLIQQLYHHRDKLQLYREVRIIDGHKFECHLLSNRNIVYDTVEEEYATKLAAKFQLNGVVSLVSIHSSSAPTSGPYVRVTDVLAVMMPNLREVNVSGSRIDGFSLEKLSKPCSRLDKLTYDNVQPFTFVSANGKDMVYAKNLRELNMDNSSFSVADITRAKMSDLENSVSIYDDNSTIFLFHECGSTVLERLSIKNAMWYRHTGGYNAKHTVIPQTALIKFIRNAPASLRYFGSDLSQANIEMLQSEEGGRGAEIEFG